MSNDRMTYGSMDRDALEAAAHAAQKRRDFNEASSLSEELRSHFPEASAGYQIGVAAATELRRLDDASALVRELLQRFPDQFWAWRAAAQVAYARRDWDEALRSAGELRDRFPADSTGYVIAAMALRESRSFDGIEPLMVEATAKFPQNVWLWKVACYAAQARRDWSSLMRWADELRRRYPQEAAGYEYSAKGMREFGRLDELDGLAREAIAAAPDQSWAWKAAVQAAQSRRDWHEALQRATELRRRFPESPVGPEMEIVTLCQLRRFEAAEALTREAAARFPDHVEFSRQAERLRQFEPFLEADRQLREKMLEAPDDRALALRYSLHADKTGREFFGGSEEIVRRLQDMARRFPEFDDAYAAHVAELCRRGQFDAAEALASSRQTRLSKNLPLALAWAGVAEIRGNIDQAASRFARVRSWFPEAQESNAGLVKTLAKLVERGTQSRREEAEAACREAIARFPSKKDFYDYYAWIAHYCGDLRVALERWERALEQFSGSAPSLYDFESRVLDARLALKEAVSAPQVLALDLARVSNVNLGMTPARLMLQYEGLGSTVYGCEFGDVQRHFKTDPLSLMRWGGGPVQSLINALEQKFEGLGDEDDTYLDVHERPSTGLEYLLCSRRYGLRFDTWITVNRASRENALEQLCRRLQFLVRKIQEDMCSDAPNKKTFVYKAYREHVTDADVEAIRRALCAHGNNTLLCMRPADGDHPEGLVEAVRPGLMVGYLCYFGKTSTGVALPVPYQSWFNVLSNAFEMRRTSQLVMGDR